MGAKKEELKLPATPTYQNDPIFQQGYQSLFNDANKLIRGDYSSFGGLQDVTSLNPETTQMALQAAQGFLQPQYNQSNLDIQNMAIANNQNTSSTFTDALAKNAFNLNSQYQGIATNAALQDAQTARAARLGLFETGLNTLTQATGFGFQKQANENQFNLENYSNLVAKAVNDQKASKGGIMGGLMGAGGGAMLGLALAPFTGGLSLAATAGLAGAGGLMGATSETGQGSQLLQLGSMFSGLPGFGGGSMSVPGFGGGQYSLPGMYASNGSMQSGFNKGFMDAFRS